MRRAFGPALLTAVGAVALAACAGSPGREAADTVTVTVAVTQTVTVDAGEDTIEQPPAPQEDAPPEPSGQTEEATVVAVDMGLGQNEGTVDYGLVLANQSQTEDALDVTITVNVLDGEQNILSTDTARLNVVPAGEAVYFGGETYLETGGRAVGLDPIIDVGRSEPAAFPLPRVRNTRVDVDEFGSVIVRGEVENTLEDALSDFARIGIVLFDESGAIVGGTFTYLMAPLPPGRRAGFQAYPTGVNPDRVASAKASVDNELATG